MGPRQALVKLSEQLIAEALAGFEPDTAPQGSSGNWLCSVMLLSGIRLHRLAPEYAEQLTAAIDADMGTHPGEEAEAEMIARLVRTLPITANGTAAEERRWRGSTQK